MQFNLCIPIWDIFIRENLEKSQKVKIHTWIPDLTNKSKLNHYQLIQDVFPNDEQNFFLSFMFYGRNYFSPPKSDEESYKLMKQIEGKRLKIVYVLKKAKCKPKIAEEWIVVKRMNHNERSSVAHLLKDYQTFIRLYGQKIILKSGARRNPFNLLYNDDFIK